MHPKSVPVRIGENEYYLRYTLGSAALLRKQFDVNLFELNEEGLGDPSVILALIFAGLQNSDNNPPPTYDELGDMIGLDDMANVAEAFGNAFARSVGSEVPAETDPPVEPQTG